MKLVCVECNSTEARLVTGASIYPNHPNLARKPIWQCPCGAYVGCHPGTENPLGRPAGPETRKARGHVHALLDPIWRNSPALYPADAKAYNIRRVARTRCYEWLADRMGLTAEECHTGMFTIDQCRQAYRLLKNITYAEIRDWAKARREKAA